MTSNALSPVTHAPLQPRPAAACRCARCRALMRQAAQGEEPQDTHGRVWPAAGADRRGACACGTAAAAPGAWHHCRPLSEL
eukprot:1138678-Pelagomonas_calceolata.AAC.7